MQQLTFSNRESYLTSMNMPTHRRKQYFFDLRLFIELA